MTFVFLTLALSVGVRKADGMEWKEHAGYRSASLTVPAGGQPGFTLMPSTSTGLVFTNQLAREAEALNQNLLNGSGLALGDYDHDGWCDVFLCNLNGSCALFRNLGGWRFTNVTVQAGLANTNWLARGAVFADVNGDGNLDLLITRSGKGVRLFLNDGHGGFRESQTPELGAETGSTSLALADVDGDGALDLYVANYGENTIRSGLKIATRQIGGKEQVVGRMRNRIKIINGALIEFGEPDVLYHNDGTGRFSRVSWTDGTFRDESGIPIPAAPWDLGLSAAFRDLNRDGAPDLYVCNDFQTPDRIWINDGHGRFQAIQREAFRVTSQFSMSVDFADVGHTGQDAVIVGDMLSREHALRMRQIYTASPPIEQTLEKALDRPQVHRNCLFLNRGDGTYVDIANYAGVATTEWTWSINFLDVDLDGWEDLLVGTGQSYDTQDWDATEKNRALPAGVRNDARTVLSLYPPLRTPNLAFRNRGDLTFEEMGHTWGFDARAPSQGVAFADLDNDGDLDVVVNCLNDSVLVYRNNGSMPRLAVMLKGNPPNTYGIGARIKVFGGAVPVQSQEMMAGGRYLAGDAPMRVFAAGSLTNDLTVEVTWRAGRRTIAHGVRANQIIEVDEKAAVLPEPIPKPNQTELFDDLSDRLAFRHQESDFDDLARQPLLPTLLSHLGPGVAWMSSSGDKFDDLVVGGSRSQKMAFFHSDQTGQLSLLPDAGFRKLPDDAAGLAAWSPGAGHQELLVGLASDESGQTNAVTGLVREGSTVVENAMISGTTSSTGPLAVADVDGDGDLDVFVGGRLIPGRYPEPASSRLLINDAGQLRIDPAASRVLEKVGLVSGAVFADLDGDGTPELVLACQWGPLRVFKHDRGSWREITEDLGLSKWLGIWTSVTAGDFDGDGRMDLVAGNLGLNSSYQQVAPGPWYLEFGDYNGTGQIQILEAFKDSSSQQVVPWRDLSFLEKTLPWLRAQFPTHLSFASATVSAMLAGRGKSERVEVNHLGSTLFLNRGGHFTMKLLPPEAQWAPVFGIAVADYDGDGREDLFLSQNDTAVRPEDPRLDGGRGLILRGDGAGGFSAMPGTESGIRIYGSQRGCAVADFDGDGRPDLAVAENNGPLHLFHNRAGRPGLQVRLQGPPGNPSAVGAVVRLRFKDGLGAARELHGGGGYWSQDSLRVVMATPQPPQAVEVRWPGGQTTQTAVSPEAKSVVIRMDGAIGAP